MKAKNLKILQDSGINVPKFVVLSRADEVTPAFMFALSPDKKYAVRSSFAGEDGSAMSYAGQFETILNVKKEELKDAIIKVLHSDEKNNVCQYNKINHVEGKNNNNRVIVQEMVDADLSGVIFTANPLGILNETVIVVGKGLGCNVVEDKINTTSYFYNQDDDLYYYEQQDNSPLLMEKTLKELIAVSEKIRNIFSYNADIEFAIKDNEIFILQTRPITTLKNKNPIILDNSNIVESYPGISLPLTQSFVRSVYHDIFYNCILRITEDEELVESMDKYLQDMTDVANWRIYYRISNWYAVLKLLPFSKKIIPMWQKMLGVNNKYVSSPDVKVTSKTKRKIVKSVLYYLKHTPELMGELNHSFSKEFPHYQGLVERAETVDDLLSVYYEIKDGILSDWDITLINDMYTFIYTALSGKKNKDLISNIKNLESMKPVMGIRDLITVIKTNKADEKVYNWYVEKYIAEYGDRCLGELKLETKTYRTHPELLHEYIKQQAGKELLPIKHIGQSEKSRNKNVERAKLGIRNREISRMNRSRLYGLSRAIFRKIGELLVKQNKLNEVDDVFYLYINEIEKYMTDYRELVVRRKEEYQMYLRVPAYSRLVFDEKVLNKSHIYTNGSVLNKKDVLEGIAPSTGNIQGRVMIVDEPDDKLDTTGKILVTKSTDPGWVFLIQNAIGIVAEKGSLLSHTAIISRELHKPAVVNVKDCTKLLHNGDLIELDADEGFVKLIERCKNEEV